MNNPLILTSKTPPDGLSISVTADFGGLAGLTLGVVSGAPLTVTVNGDPLSPPYLLTAGDILTLIRTDTSTQASVIAAWTEDSYPAVTVISEPISFPFQLGNYEGRSYSLPLPSGANGLSIRLSGGRGDVDMDIRRPDNTRIQNLNGDQSGNVETLFEFQVPAGTYTVNLVGTAELNTAMMTVDYDPFGALPDPVTLTATAIPQALTLPVGATYVEFAKAEGEQLEISYDAGANYQASGTNAFSYTLDAALAAGVRIREISGQTGGVTYRTYVP
ncbi:PPC domain-containing protein [Deinococcus sp. QL22]|uniref:PPC domain-containing protein n=1 Tax=Deinococcus sp. QL22 TaxID=2939437 RepID=UPI002017850B|nr:PPC domain-containing protein [Deinococcus sp. QL22]UQN05443.1 PPC domain-containing protein [Deinococcus sp. QL22]